MVFTDAPAKKNGDAVTLEDVARRAGVASSTASYVLNNKPKPFGVETRERVWTAARELGYRPNMAARSLATNRTNIIALWVPDVASAFSARVIAEMQRQVWRDGYEVLISQLHIAQGIVEGVTAANGAPATTVKPPRWDCDGIIAFLGSSCRNARLETLSARNVPVVSMGAFPIADTDFVGVELFTGTQIAVRRLVANGCRRIAYLVPILADFAGDDRREAYREVVAHAGLERIVISARDNSRRAGREAMTAFLASGGRIDGLFCYNDDAAIGAYRALRDAGLRLPEDVALFGCDGIEDTEYLDCHLSTLVLPLAEMCSTGWQFLRQRLLAPETPAQKVVFSGRFEPRESM